MKVVVVGTGYVGLVTGTCEVVFIAVGGRSFSFLISECWVR